MSSKAYTKRKKIIRWSVFFALIVLFVAVYLLFDPSGNALFPKCPFKLATGWDCPGCGSQRAIHHLLNGEVTHAWHMNPLFLIAIPYVILGIYVEIFGNKYAWAGTLRSKLYGSTAAWIALAIIVTYTVLRNII